ncbi:extracellular alpha-1,4-glucan glucosidase [Fusarium denticulatum]|uniref:Extracellular alpha-1,4-glucan glucosidase n=1 Tax=Fusarium denticulatum TaxID=48507 RepID=A0A8H5U128_9HYPO|nr:extracellular alpha-1,4-glucan glucosidase [Fusarium denticulatum]
MAPPIKSADVRRKSSTKASLIVTRKVSPDKLRALLAPDSIKEESPSKDLKANADSSTDAVSASGSQPPASNTNGDNASDSNAATPVPDATPADGTPAPSAMGPPTDGAKKKGVKRSAAGANGTIDGVPKPRGKPGPKKKPRLEDGTIDHSGSKPAGGHKLGPKANQGAINAGLRALDRSGKPCRRWAKGGFQLKSFTGVAWEIPRWVAPQKKVPESSAEDSTAASAEGSSKENKENGHESNSASNSNTANDVEMQSAPSNHASSPVPLAIAAAS